MQTMTAGHGHNHYAAQGFHPMRWLTRALATRHQRMRLDELDDHLLRDIGVDRRTARTEAHRSFWDMP